MARTVLINLRTTEDERRLFKDAAQQDGLSLSRWMRQLALLRAAELETRRPAKGKGARRRIA